MKDPGARRWSAHARPRTWNSADLARSRLGVELAVVLAAIWVPLFAWSVIGRIDPQELTALSISGGLVWGVGMTALLVHLVWNRNGTLRPLGIRRTRWWAEALWAVPIFVLLVAANRSAWQLSRIFGWESLTWEKNLKPPRGLVAVLLPVYFLVSAAFEETFIRGYLWDRLRRTTRGKTRALLLSSAFFAAYHPYPPLDLAVIFVSGLVLGLFFMRFRSLPRLVLAHAGLNIWIMYG
ncbi:MAG: CPBP family intramembrane metalloprotease [Planctomycetes bacterium]|nr:CPBP family intramembrane metalloprotease [Planctomycetota bacterium]